MTQDNINPTPVVTLSETAAGRIKDMFEQNNLSDAALRVFLRESEGGYAHAIAPETEISADDTVSEQYGLTVVVDQNVAPALQGTHVDFQDDGGSGAFTVTNPNFR